MKANDEVRGQLVASLPRLLEVAWGAGARMIAAKVEPVAFEVINPATAGLFRCRLELEVAGRARRVGWVVKLIHRRRADPRGPRAWDYWRREACFYSSELAGNVRALTPPRCDAVAELGPYLAICLEELPPQPSRWPAARHALVARRLGRFSAESLGGAAAVARSTPWLSRGWLRQALAQREQALPFLRDPRTWAAPLVRQAFPVPVQLRVLYLYAQVDAFLARLERAPQTLCHFDAYQPNLFVHGRGGRQQVHAIDWSFVGVGALGTDLGQMIAGNLMWLFVPPGRAPAYLTGVSQAYLQGLREGGFGGPGEPVLEAANVSAALRAAGYLPFILQSLLAPQRRAPLARMFRAPLSKALPQFGRAMEVLLRLGGGT